MSQHFVVGQLQAVNLITRVAKETFQVDDQVDIAAEEEGVFGEIAGSDNSEIFQRNRCIRKIAKKTKPECAEVDFRSELFVEFAFGNFHYFSPESKRKRQQRSKNDSYN